ncbi:MAG TPA: type II toxin-antitoxin system Phd/YefM family antitoxin [Acidobacteriaceae bacterium]|jgi:prevent-host-death family protein|nr:type II toxin-antitoxin system Phd/YefM family antitoxin [Acidobacteriaceae bacterium]
MKKLGAASAKAQFLALLTEVETKREPVLVTKNGKPVATISPLDIPKDVDPLDAYRFDGVEIVGDITAPLFSDKEYEEFDQATLAQLQ